MMLIVINNVLVLVVAVTRVVLDVLVFYVWFGVRVCFACVLAFSCPRLRLRSSSLYLLALAASAAILLRWQLLSPPTCVLLSVYACT